MHDKPLVTMILAVITVIYTSMQMQVVQILVVHICPSRIHDSVYFQELHSIQGLVESSRSNNDH